MADEPRQAGAQSDDFIEVTPEMVAAGLDEMGEHRIGDDLAYVVEAVFRAMAYLSPSASFISASK